MDSALQNKVSFVLWNFQCSAWEIYPKEQGGACEEPAWQRERRQVRTVEQVVALADVAAVGQLRQQPLADAVALLWPLPHEVLQQEAVLHRHLAAPVGVRRHLQQRACQ